jgi:SAM-dependent methyltransferase
MSRSPIHPQAALGFGSAAEEYERGRPEYPRDAVEFLAETFALTPGCLVIDLAAGTGKLTRALPRDVGIIAVEPVAAMRAELARQLPGVEILSAVAEALPLRPGIADAVLVANAWHWFDGHKALREVNRVLRRGGGLGIVYNRRDESCDWVAQMSGIVDRWRGHTPAFRSGAWKSCFSDNALFSPLQQRTFAYEQSMTLPALRDRVASISFIATLAEAERATVLDEIAELVRDRFTGSHTFAMPHNTEVFWAFSR